jgi:Fe-S oxidoreductase
MISHWQLDALIVSCGTCKSALANGEVEGIFSTKLLDIAAFLAQKGLRLSSGAEATLYHAPCHDSLGGTGVRVLEEVTGARVPLSGRCCSEAGTLAMSRPDIAQNLRVAKALDIERSLGATLLAGSTILTNCPSCLQGMSRQKNSTTKAEHIAVAWAKALGGKNWKREFELMAKNADRVDF